MPIAPAPLPPLDVLESYFRYDPNTGFIWNRISNTNRRSGERAESSDAAGYAVVSVKGRVMKAHRVAWYLHYGTEPGQFIDHADGNKANNKISNLRLASHLDNMKNTKTPKTNTTGHRNVYLGYGGAWKVLIRHGGQRTFYGSYRTKAEACDVAARMRKKLHGRFASDR